jgi:hypothetical protein
MRWLAVSVLCTGAFVAFMPSPVSLDAPDRVDPLRQAAAMLRGDGLRSDFAADFVGARALRTDRSAYPVLGPEFAALGLNWPIQARNTHPPTAFLLSLPVSGMSWPAASATWAWLVLGMFAVTTWALGARWPVALAIAPLWLLWPPAAWSVGQMTAVWLAGVALAYRFRDRPWIAGIALGVAAWPKLLPALLLAPFVLRREWRAVAGFAATAAVGLLALAALNPSVFQDYLTLGRAESQAVIEIPGNGALLPSWLGTETLVLVLAGLAVVAVLTLWARSRWSPWEWGAVALLPIAWTYSLLPLAPILWASVRSRGPAAIPAVIAVGLPVATLYLTPWVVTDVIALSGVAAALLATEWGSRPWRARAARQRSGDRLVDAGLRLGRPRRF